MRTVVKWVLAALTIGMLFIWLHWGVSPIRLSEAFLSTPPVEIEARVGFLSDAVIQVRNTSNRSINATVTIYNGYRGDKVKGKIAAGSWQEFGALEFTNGWKPKNGDKGFVQVDGFARVAVFELRDDKYFLHFEFGPPDDAPRSLCE